MNKDAIKKYHFWALAVLAVLFAVLSVASYWNDVGAEVEKKEKEVEGKLTEVKGAKPKGTKVLKDLDDQKEALAKKREELWEDNWRRQAVEYKLFEWPPDNDPTQRLANLARENVKFGQPIDDRQEAFDVLKRVAVYERAYEQAAAAVRPTGFAGGSWRGVLRYVSDWTGRKPRWEQVWLALEDLWVQRALLLPVREVNTAAAAFEPVPAADGADGKLKRSFRSRIWQLDLDASDGRTLRGKLTNRTDRLQLLGTGNTLRLRVWLSDAGPPVYFPIEGEFVKAGDTIPVPFVPAYHNLPPGTDAARLVRVEQRLDERTVPVRQVLNVELGYPDGRTTAVELRPPPFFTDEATGAQPVPAAVVARPAKTGTPAQVLDGNKARYFDQTPQVRRMPVALTLVVDQMFMQDALIAYANSPLRFQITQSYWRRARRLADAPPAAAPPPPPPAGNPIGDGGGLGGEGGFGGDPGFGGPGPAGGGVPFSPAPLSGLSDGQLTSGLVELTLHGVISLYEKFDRTASAAGAADAPAPPPAP